MDQNATCYWNEQDIVFSIFKNIENLKVLTFFPSTGSYRPILTLGPVVASILLVSSILKISKEGKYSFSLCSVAKLCPTLWGPMDCSWAGSSVCGFLNTRILEWVAIPFSRRSSWPMDQTCVSRTAGRFFIAEPSGKPKHLINNSCCHYYNHHRHFLGHEGICSYLWLN